MTLKIHVLLRRELKPEPAFAALRVHTAILRFAAANVRAFPRLALSRTLSGLPNVTSFTSVPSGPSSRNRQCHALFLYAKTM